MDGSWPVAVLVPVKKGSQGRAMPAGCNFGSAEIFPGSDLAAVTLQECKSLLFYNRFSGQLLFK